MQFCSGVDTATHGRAAHAVAAISPNTTPRYDRYDRYTPARCARRCHFWTRSERVQPIRRRYTDTPPREVPAKPPLPGPPRVVSLEFPYRKMCESKRASERRARRSRQLLLRESRYEPRSPSRSPIRSCRSYRRRRADASIDGRSNRRCRSPRRPPVTSRSHEPGLRPAIPGLDVSRSLAQSPATPRAARPCDGLGDHPRPFKR
jgi:hypothetical protein